MTNTTGPFSKEFLDKMKALLLAERARLGGELGTVTNKGAEASGTVGSTFPEYGSDEDENVQEIEQFTVNKPLEVSLENTLRDIDKALKRLEAGEYGICKYCDKPIDEKRLLARPTSSACVSCKKLLTDEA